MSLYRACGLVIDSEVALAECPPAAIDETTSPDVRLCLGTIDPEWGEPTDVPYIRHMPGGALHFGEDDGPRFLVSKSTVVVDPSKSGWRRFFIGPVLGALCYLNDRLPLHASAVDIDGVAVVFAGPSGAGKSTLAAALVHRHGRRLISDELSALRLTAPTPVVFPYLRYHRLSDASAACLDLDAIRSAAGIRDFDKTLVTARDVTSEITPCQVIYLLKPANDTSPCDSVLCLPSADAAAEIMDNLYRRDIGELCRPVSGLLGAAATLVGQVQVRVLSYDADTPALRGLAETVLADVDSQRNAMTALASRSAD
ncbi:MAG: hypothetical protein U0Q11_05465 [Vicinamibacterales bacterium]